MSLLDKASLIQIPSGYKNGKLYSVKPTPTYGSELVTNGDFATDSDWNKGANWTISGGTANRTANATSNISQVISGISGKKIQVVFTVSNYGGSGGVGASANGNDYNENSGNGTFTEQITPTSDNLYIRASYAFVGSIDNVSVKEITNIGDFTFSRSSSGTRVNSAGLVEVAKVIGTTEEVTNGDFSSGGSWSGSASISGGQLTKTSGGLAYQSGVVTANKYYKVVVDVASLDGATKLYFGGNQYTLSVGVQTIEAVGGTSNTFVGFNNGYSSGSGSVFNSISVIEYIENDVPRLDYSGGATCASLLLEGQSTNLEEKSNGFSTWSSNSNITRTADYITSPDGTQNATRLQFTANGFCANKTQSLASYTISCYAKRNNSGTENVGFFTNGSGVVNSAWAVTSEWKRFSYTFPTLNAGAMGIAGVSGADISVYGFQIEGLATYATSYIPTSGATATRTADSGILTSASALIGQTEGTLYSEFNLTEDSAFTILEINLGNSTNNRILAYRNASYIAFIVQVGGVIEINNSTLVTFLDTNKIAITYQANNFKIYLNGSLVKAYTSGSIPSGFDTIDFQDNNLAGKKQSIKSLILFKEILSDTELATLTTL